MPFKSSNKIAILMATYNGEKYLSEQLNSLLGQTNNEWTLYIHDDGSNDNTIKIIEEYTRQYPHIILLSDEGSHRGPEGSFKWLLQQVEAEYYMFADQDDFWESDKVQKSFAVCKEIEKLELPTLIATNLSITDSHLNNAYIAWEGNVLKSVCDVNNSRVTSLYSGCTMFFNRNLRDLYISELNPFGLLHDRLINFINIKNKGSFKFIKEPLIKYRQHESNVMGMKKVANAWLYRKQHIREIIHAWLHQYKVAKFYLDQSFIEYMWYYLRWKYSSQG